MAYLAMPPNSDEIAAPMDLVIGFRLASGFTMSIFWGLLGIILGAFLEKLKPHETAKVTISIEMWMRSRGSRDRCVESDLVSSLKRLDRS
jgi:hypothetical protein